MPGLLNGSLLVAARRLTSGRVPSTVAPRRGTLARVDPALKCRAIFLRSLRDSFRVLRERSLGQKTIPAIPVGKAAFSANVCCLEIPFSLFLALRYLKPKRTFISIITLVSVLGVTLGVTVLILVISVMTGFDRELRQKVIDFDAHIQVTTEGVMSDWRDLTVKIRNTPGVVATAP